MTQFDWERARAKNTKVKTPQVRRAPKRTSADYDWENPAESNRVPYVWEHDSLKNPAENSERPYILERVSPVNVDRTQARLQELSQPLDDGYNLLRIYFNPFGRLNRAAYVKRWVPLLLITAIYLRLFGLGSGMPGLFGYSISHLDMPSYMAIGVFLVLYAASKALQVRRLHDLGLCAMWLGATLVVDAGLVFASGGLWPWCLVLALVYNFIFLYFYGSFGPNKYGPDPILRDLGDNDPFTPRTRVSWQGKPLILDIIFFIARLFLRG